MYEMKKIAAVALALVLVVIWGCSSGSQLSDDAYALGTQALTVVDKYLDMEISSSVAREKIEDIRDQLGDVEDAATPEYRLETCLLSLPTDLLVENYADITEQRNNIAKLLGKEER